MNSIIEKTSDRSRSLLFGILLSCLLADEDQDDCPLSHLRTSLSVEEKYNYIMALSTEEVDSLVELHTKCFEEKTRLNTAPGMEPYR